MSSNNFNFSSRGKSFILPRLMTLISGWKLNGSMIEFKGNLDIFFINYARNVCSYMKIRFSSPLYKSYKKLGKRMFIIQWYRGINQCIIRLKVSAIVILNHLAGTPLQNTNDLGQRVKLVNGLPAWIPAHLRQIIRARSIDNIRVLLSVLHSYKGMKGLYKDPDLSSITAPKFFKPMKGEEDLFAVAGLFPKVMPWAMLSDMSEVLKTRNLFWRLYNRSNVKVNFDFDTEDLPLNLKAGPNSPVAFLGAAVDAVGHLNMGKKSPLLRFIAYVTQRNDDLSLLSASSSFSRALDLMSKVATDSIKSIRSKSQAVSTVTKEKIMSMNSFLMEAHKADVKETRDIPLQRIAYAPGSFEHLMANPHLIKLGKLAIKLEAAGKVRVFAITDYWTQVFMKPIHTAMFKILRDLPMDATFDQLTAVENFCKVPHTYIASFDLKSATDLIPQQLYIDVLQPWFDPSGLRPELSAKWMDVLVNREYHFQGSTYKYTRGQPMGALSSWSSLAIIHHYLVFLAAFRVNLISFGDYLVLGDDIVIGNKLVAESYKAVCSDYGVTIGLAKSFVSSESFFQFASQDMLGETNLSPVSLKEILSITQIEYQFKKIRAFTAVGPRVEFINRMIRKAFVKNNETGTIFDQLRPTMSFETWLKVSRELSKGILPKILVPVIVSLLTSTSKLEANKFSISHLMGALRGDIRMLTGDKEASLQDQNAFVSSLVEELNNGFIALQSETMEKIMKFGAQNVLDGHPLGRIFSDSIGSRVTRDLMKIRTVRKSWDEVVTKVSADDSHNSIVYLLWDGSQLDAHISYLNLHRLFELRKELDMIQSDLDLMNTALAELKSGHSPKRAKTFLSFIAKYGKGQSAW
jgi:hypothetical protein